MYKKFFLNFKLDFLYDALNNVLIRAMNKSDENVQPIRDIVLTRRAPNYLLFQSLAQHKNPPMSGRFWQNNRIVSLLLPIINRVKICALPE